MRCAGDSCIVINFQRRWIVLKTMSFEYSRLFTFVLAVRRSTRPLDFFPTGSLLYSLDLRSGRLRGYRFKLLTVRMFIFIISCTRIFLFVWRIFRGFETKVMIVIAHFVFCSGYFID